MDGAKFPDGTWGVVIRGFERASYRPWSDMAGPSNFEIFQFRHEMDLRNGGDRSAWPRGATGVMNGGNPRFLALFKTPSPAIHAWIAHLLALK
jgi:hypothetical protein